MPLGGFLALERSGLYIMRWDTFYKSFLVISLFFLASCSNLKARELPITTSTPQLPLNQAETILPSPDGKWVAYIFGLFGNKDYKLSVVNFEDTIVWNINQKNFGGESWLIPYRWSQDSRYLYFNIYAAIDGYVPFYQGMGLQRLDVQNGQVSEILPSGYPETLETRTIYNWDLAQFSLSPEDNKLAYINRMENGVQLVIRELNTNKENSIFFDKYTDAGKILWSPNQDYLVFAASNGTNWSNTLGYIDLIELDTLTTKSILRDTNQVLVPLAWLSHRKILVREYGGSYFHLDIISKELSPVPPSFRFPN